jgi:hypothetical protein
VFYESTFDVELEDTLISNICVRRAVERGKHDDDLPFTGMVRDCYSFDVAKHDMDRNVLTTTRTNGTHNCLKKQK